MKPDWVRVAGIAGVLATGVAAALLWKPAAVRASTPVPAWTPWIGVPATDERMSSQNAREALLELQRIEESELEEPDFRTGGTLLGRCGEDFGSGPDADVRETYVIRMADSAFGGAKGWRIELLVEDDRVRVKVLDAAGSFVPPPPPPPGASAVATRPEVHSPRLLATSKARLQPIVDAWRGDRGWNAPQQTVGCLDGRPLILEACVRGRYAMRNLRCDALGLGDDRLWRELHELLPLEDSTVPPSGKE